jgi:hypothetical protein
LIRESFAFISWWLTTTETPVVVVIVTTGFYDDALPEKGWLSLYFPNPLRWFLKMMDSAMFSSSGHFFLFLLLCSCFVVISDFD